MVIWTLAKKDLRLLVRDARAMIILLVMPLLFILVLGLSVGEGFGKKEADRLRVSVLNLDEGLPESAKSDNFPKDSWSAQVLHDLAESADIRIERIATRAEAEALVKSGRRAAVLVLGPNFSKQVHTSSFLAGGINPFYRDGIHFKMLEVEVLRDPTQATAAAIIDQVAQGSLLRVVLPWMIGRAFEKIGDPDFLTLLGQQKEVPFAVRIFLSGANKDSKRELGVSLQKAIQNLFPKYHLTAKTWASLTKEKEHDSSGSKKMTDFAEEGQGFLKRGALRYQTLVPSYLVMFSFFLVLTVGWLFVAERRQGTMKRLVVAPLARWQIVLGKLLPCLVVSLFQGFFLLIAGRLIFGMSWGEEPLWLAAVVASTSLAAMGLAMLVASIARTETQVAIFGTMLVLILAGVSGALMGDRENMPEQMKEISLATPHGWALDAYRQLLGNQGAVEVARVAQSCAVLVGFGLVFLLLSWAFLKLET